MTELMKNNSNCCQLLDLNDDCLLHIAKYLSNAELDHIFRYVCQRFLAVYRQLRREHCKIFGLYNILDCNYLKHTIPGIGDMIESVCCSNVMDLHLDKFSTISLRVHRMLNASIGIFESRWADRIDLRPYRMHILARCANGKI